MTDDQRNLAIWGGSAAVIVIAGWVYLASDDLAGKLSSAEAKQGEYEKKYVNARSGELEGEARKRLEQFKVDQVGSLNEAENLLVASLPKEFTPEKTDIMAAQNTVQRTNAALRDLCEKAQVKPAGDLITALPDDPDQRSLQLARLWVWRETALLLIDGGFKAIPNPGLVPPAADPTGKYARLGVELTFDGPWEQVTRLMNDSQLAHRRGLGLREIEIVLNKDGSRKVKFQVTALIPNQPGWKLVRDAATAVGKAAPGPKTERPRLTPSTSTSSAGDGNGRL